MVAIRTVTCKKCQSSVSVDHIRYDRNGRDLICTVCSQREPDNAKPTPDREKLMCLKCSYKFGIKKDSRLPRKCPYCASPNITRHVALTAQQVLHEVSEQPERGGFH